MVKTRYRHIICVHIYTAIVIFVIYTTVAARFPISRNICLLPALLRHFSGHIPNPNPNQFPTQMAESDHSTFGWDTTAFTNDEHVVVSSYLLLFVILLATSVVGQHVVSKVWLWQSVPESAVTLVIGMVVVSVHIDITRRQTIIWMTCVEL